MLRITYLAPLVNPGDLQVFLESYTWAYRQPHLLLAGAKARGQLLQNSTDCTTSEKMRRFYLQLDACMLHRHVSTLDGVSSWFHSAAALLLNPPEEGQAE